MPTPIISSRVQEFLEQNRDLETPFLLIDLDQVERQFLTLRQALPSVACYYAMKANSAAPVIRRLLKLGSRFEAAGIHEVRKCLELGVPPRDVHFGNTIKKASDVAEAFRLGVHSFTFDSEVELEKIARLAPGSNVSCRLATDGLGAVWGLSRKFGRNPEEVVELMTAADRSGLRAYGVSFHVGSQQRDPGAWRRAIRNAADVIHTLNRKGVRPRLINLGGGYPSYHYASADLQPNADIFEYGKVIRSAIDEYLPEGIDCVMEPGRFLCAESGTIKAQVILVSDRLTDSALKRWVYLDVGRFNGMYESVDVAYPCLPSRTGGEVVPTVLAGPTCDSDDVMYDHDRAVLLPSDLCVGDTLLFSNAGAYTRSYTTVGFNGFPPLAEYFI